MTVNELIQKLNDLQISGDETISIHARTGGLGGAVSEISSVSLGFDWTSGRVMLHPTPQLMAIPAKDVEPRCKWCGRTLGDHAERHAEGMAMRMPCGGLKSGFFARAV